jgi:hypothetical protein
MGSCVFLYDERETWSAENYPFFLENPVCLAYGHGIHAELERKRSSRWKLGSWRESSGRYLKAHLIYDLPKYWNSAVRIDEDQQGELAV